ncbi:MAG: hypothetical protein WCE73_11060, partial [Candidatus Angelobacter sp.]
MKLSFYTPPQSMAFVDPVTHNLTNAGQLKAGVIYDVFAVVKNEDAVEYPDVHINVTHTAFGIGLPGGTSYIVQPEPIDVPPALNVSQPGLATFQFHFMAPPAGHGCLIATIVPNNVRLNQNLTVLTAPYGASTISFLVFGDPNLDETMVLTLQQKLENGTPVTPANHWPHQFVVPQALTPTPNPSSDTVTLHIPRGSTYYSIGINVTIPPTATDAHIFFVRGTVNGVDKGSVSLLVKPDPTFIKPAPYIIGGIESADIVLVDANGNEVPILNNPTDIHSTPDTHLTTSTDYTLRAIIHNDSPTPAVNTLVRFFESPGGIGGQPDLLDIQTVTVPGHGHVEVTSQRKFHSGQLLNEMKCAIVTLYNPQSDICNVPDLLDALAKMQTGHEGPAAMRNTHSTVVFIGDRFHINLAAAYPRIPLPHPVPPVELHVESVLIPHDWRTLPEAIEANQMLEAS